MYVVTIAWALTGNQIYWTLEHTTHDCRVTDSYLAQTCDLSDVASDNGNLVADHNLQLF
jgi:hypothetical protein